MLRAARSVACLTAVLLGAACGDGAASAGGAPTISREAFVEVMVDLRTSPLLDPSGLLPSGEPERILEENGVTAEQMRSFVEVHGGDVPFMAEVWTEIDARVVEARRATEPRS